MSVTRWEPLGNFIGLREALDTLLEQSFVQPNAGATQGATVLAVDVEDRGDAYVIEAAVPGATPENVEIAVMGDVVRIHTQRRDEREERAQGGRWLVREQRFGEFERTLRLPTAVEAGAAQADFKDGILTITLPKAEASRERRIPVSTGSDSGQSGQTRARQATQASEGSAKGARNAQGAEGRQRDPAGSQQSD